MRDKAGQIEGINDLAGLGRSNPLLALALALLMFSLAGIPPLAGFFAKFYVFLAAVHAGLYVLAVIGVLASVIGAYYYLRIIKIMYFDEPAEATDWPMNRRRCGSLWRGPACSACFSSYIRCHLSRARPRRQPSCSNSSGLRMSARLPWGYDLIHFEEIDSTMDEARRQAAKGVSGPLWIMADRQTKGRGRRSRTWESGAGNLLCTLLINPGIAAAEAAKLSFLTALCVGETLDHFLGAAHRVRLKWPNDVLLDGRKAAGILLESVSGGGGMTEWLAIGIGINLARHPEPAPASPGVAPAWPAISLRCGGGGAATRPGNRTGGAGRPFGGLANPLAPTGICARQSRLAGPCGAHWRGHQGATRQGDPSRDIHRTG